MATTRLQSLTENGVRYTHNPEVANQELYDYIGMRYVWYHLRTGKQGERIVYLERPWLENCDRLLSAWNSADPTRWRYWRRGDRPADVDGIHSQRWTRERRNHEHDANAETARDRCPVAGNGL